METANITGLLDYEGAAPYLHCSPRMVRKLVESRQLDSIKVGSLVRIEPEAIQRYVDANRRGPSSDATKGPARGPQRGHHNQTQHWRGS